MTDPIAINDKALTFGIAMLIIGLLLLALQLYFFLDGASNAIYYMAITGLCGLVTLHSLYTILRERKRLKKLGY